MDKKVSYGARWGHPREQSHVYHTNSGVKARQRQQGALDRLVKQLATGLKFSSRVDSSVPLEEKDKTRIQKEIDILVTKGLRLTTQL